MVHLSLLLWGRYSVSVQNGGGTKVGGGGGGGQYLRERDEGGELIGGYLSVRCR